LVRSPRNRAAPPEVAQAAARGHKIIDAAWLILGNRAQRQRYDEQVGVVRKGEGLARPEPAAPGPDLDLLESAAGVLYAADGLYWGDLQESLGVLADLLAAAVPRLSLRRSPDLIVPDVRGMLFRACQDAVTMAGFRIRTIRLTENPMPVEGLVVGQSPAPGQTVPRFSALTIHAWHPPRLLSRGQ
jgi:hypothetical protein